ncbi:MAG: CBS domain-containing protein [Nanoarchaeota archaeon]|nr:CBS domain-containing protein [Nanoarchaeota archaeon]MBU1029940.1 CBS domain-containing protein [Nanoarchaeota archaeon]
MTFENNLALLREKQIAIFSDEIKVKRLFAKDAMMKPVFLYPDDNVKIILKKLKKESINECIVISRDKKFLGEISDEDINKLFLEQVKQEPLVKTLNTGYRREFNYKSARELMNEHKSTATLDTPINELIELICQEGFHHIPIIDDNERVIGVVTPSSIINLLKDY